MCLLFLSRNIEILRSATSWVSYPGSTPFVGAIAGAGTCTKQPCLFDLEADPRETVDLATQQPNRTAQLWERYKQLATQLYAPNAVEAAAAAVAPRTGAGSESAAAFAAAAAAAFAAEWEGVRQLEASLALPSACADDACWERRAHELQMRRRALAAAAAAARPAPPGRQQLVEGAPPHGQQQSKQQGGDSAAAITNGCAQLAQLTGAAWHLGSEDSDTFAFSDQQASRGPGAVSMAIVQGCGACKFTRADGTLDTASARLHVVASGKGVNYSHTATLTRDVGARGRCRLHWGDNWRDFCQGGPCASAPPPPSPEALPHACRKMLSAGGFWQPYCAPSSPHGECVPL
jgi:hypothetical protein